MYREMAGRKEKWPRLPRLGARNRGHARARRLVRAAITYLSLIRKDIYRGYRGSLWPRPELSASMPRCRSRPGAFTLLQDKRTAMRDLANKPYGQRCDPILHRMGLEPGTCIERRPAARYSAPTRRRGPHGRSHHLQDHD